MLTTVFSKGMWGRKENNADYLLTYKLNFEKLDNPLQTEKDSTILKNAQLMKYELNKSVLADTFFGDIRIYRIQKQSIGKL